MAHILAPSPPLSPISILESKISAPIRHPPFCSAEQNWDPRLACLGREFTQPLRRGSARSGLRHFPEKISPTTSRRRRRRRTPLFDKVSKKGIHLSRDRKGRISYHFGFGRRTKSFIIKSSPTSERMHVLASDRGRQSDLGSRMTSARSTDMQCLTVKELK